MDIEFKLNGHDYSVPIGSKLQDLIHELGLVGQALSILINRSFVPHQHWARELKSGDKVEIGLSNPSHCGTRLQE